MAYSWYQKAADGGHAVAQYYIGNFYQVGIYVNVDYNIAFHYYNLSAKGGTAVDKRIAFELYLKAANMKYSVSQYNVAVCYEDGIGTTKDSEKAMEWYKKSADKGYDLAMIRLDELSLLKSAKEK